MAGRQDAVYDVVIECGDMSDALRDEIDATQPQAKIVRPTDSSGEVPAGALAAAGLGPAGAPPPAPLSGGTPGT